MTEPTDTDTDELKVSPLELFFDLVFVFAVTEIAVLLRSVELGEALVAGLLVAMLVWWAWSQYTWALNAFGTARTVVRLALLGAMAGSFFMALAVPDATEDGGLWFAAGYAVVVGFGLALYVLGLPAERRAVVMAFTRPAALGVVFVFAGGFADGDLRLLLWGLGAAVQVAAAFYAADSGDFGVKPAHFAERHSLFVIIALGEVIVATGVAAVGGERTIELTVALAGTFLVAAALWWAYFDWLAEAMERRLGVPPSEHRAPVARDLYTLGHFPLIAGIVLFAVAAEEAVAHPGEHLEGEAVALLAVGLALLAAGFGFLAWRSGRVVVWERLAAGAVAAGAVVLAQDLDGGLVLWIVALVIAAAVVAERRRMGIGATRP